jgi:UDP-GlcNAc:undecaprenyl-phosphate/decaprenyl-phosphate GlcNAc-1-phosphate transferase
MITRLADLFPIILTTLLAAVILGPLAVKAARRWGWVDVPGSAPHKRHVTPTPLAGGPVLALSLLACYLILRPPGDESIAGMLAGALLVMVGGLVDDRIPLPPLLKLLVQALAAGALIAFGVRVHVTRLEAVDLTLTVLWVVGMVNAFNFVDSMDGLALGLGGIAAAFFMLVTIDSLQPMLAVLSAALLGSAIGVFLYNASPAKMFLGDSGAQLLGFLLAAIGLAYVPASAELPQGVSWFTPILVLGVPIFDISLAVFSRLWRHRPVYRAGNDHTYHRLLELGLDPTRAVLLMHLAGVLLGLVAFMALDASVLIANLVFVGVLLAGLAAVLALEAARARRLS